MSTLENQVNRHYGKTGLVERIVSWLWASGKSIDSISVNDLAPIDAFHTRGRESSVELSELGDFQPTDLVLDIGCGAGGSARYLASTHGCQVQGIDLTHDFVETAKRLTEWVGLADQCSFVQGSALELPFADNTFDLAWTEHVQMNIADKDRFYWEISRVLKPGGRLLFHDIFMKHGQPAFPVPWAEDESISALATTEQVQSSMKQAGLTINSWREKVGESIEFFDQALTRIDEEGTPLGIQLVMGDSARQKIENYVEALKAQQVTVVLGAAVLDANG